MLGQQACAWSRNAQIISAGSVVLALRNLHYTFVRRAGTKTMHGGQRCEESSHQVALHKVCMCNANNEWITMIISQK